MLRNKLIYSIIAVAMAVFCTSVYATEGVIDTFTVDGSGETEIIGYFDDTEAPYDAAMLMYDGTDLGNLSGNIINHVMYLDQLPLGNNGTFYYHFMIDKRFSSSPYVLKINGGTLIEKSGILPDIPTTGYNISDNAMRIGNDAYDIGVYEYTPENIAQSIKEGGNKIWYKIGGMWFDMLDPNATSNAYFTQKNAIPDEKIQQWTVKYYYHFGL